MSSNQWQGRGGKGNYGGSSSKKRKANTENNQASSSSASTSHSSANKKPRGAPQPKQNTAIYVTGLPPDATVDEVHELFSRKCGVVAEEIDSGKPRIKLYTDSEGNPKGDALIVFFKPQSVEMAMMLLDDTTFRFGDTTSEPMRIQPADSTYKKTQYAEEGAGEENTSSNTPMEGSNSDVPAAAGEPEQGAGKKKIRTEKEKAKIKAKAQKMNDKLADWSDDEPYYAEQQQKKQAGRWEKVVILKHMFTLQELDEDPTAILDIKEDIRDECAKLGEVTNVVLFDLEPEGIVSVKFTDVDAAEACVNLMNGRNFGGQTVEASIATGKERFKQSKKKQTVDSDEEDED